MAPIEHKFHSLQRDQNDEIVSYLGQYTPYSSSILGFFVRAINNKVSVQGEYQVYCSHAQLSTTTAEDQVILLLAQPNRLRVFLNTEKCLNEAEPTWMGQDEIGLEHGHFEFEDENARGLYEKSQDLLEAAIRFVGWKQQGIFFHGLSVLWTPLLYKMFKVPYNGPCVRYICSVEKYLHKETPQSITVNGEELMIGSVTVQDIDKVIANNKIPFEKAYVQECSGISTALRRQDGELVAWGLTHSDGAICALHVLQSWRRLGLAQMVLDDLCVKQAKDFSALHKGYRVYLQGVVENYNTASKAVFHKSGWKIADIGLTWAQVTLMAFVFELKDLTNDKLYQLEPNIPVLVGRGEKFDIHDRTVSRKQIQLEALSDGRCFVERLSENPSLLGTKLLPLKNKVEVKHNDIINLLPVSGYRAG
ncbi:hypothetical protein INT43_000502 [Umbelopsis isabellina]|uniref:N-acetyltransferase domain-containing protein n=1 Tax=Mortierella isabellina TaxID=91625 RepID=A0A8H7Q292_MORIS|nr:hypothetical protein INT43_000502 [Umbelopsis isabellina]